MFFKQHVNRLSLSLGILSLLAGCGGDSDKDNGPSTDNGGSTPWRLVWSDEFDGRSINSSKWTHEENCWGGGNNEQQCYVKDAKNAFVKDGILNIVALNDYPTGFDLPDGNGQQKTLPYSSARLRTKAKGDWTYGRFEIRAKLPEGQGTWPAIWMLPTDNVYGVWAASGEIDIVEAVNLKTPSDDYKTPGQAGKPESRVHGTLHYGGAWPRNVYTGKQYYLPNDLNPADDFHVYALEWEKDEIRWYVDGVHYQTQRSNTWYSISQTNVTAKDDAPFNQKFHLLLNLAVGGNWASNTNDTGIHPNNFPQTLQVDYVRVYECSVDPSSGKGCANIQPQATIVTH